MNFRHLPLLAASLIIFSACDKARDNAVIAEQKAREAAARMDEMAKKTAAEIEEKTRKGAEATEAQARQIADNAKSAISNSVGSTETYAEADKAAFITALEPIKKLCEEMKNSDPAGEPPFDQMHEFLAAMRALPTQGMPADLQAAMDAANDKTEELIGAMKSVAADPASVTPETVSSIKTLRAEGKVLSEKAIELAAKHGIDLSFFGLMN